MRLTADKFPFSCKTPQNHSSVGLTSLIIMHIFIWRESICPGSMKLGRQLVICMVIFFPKCSVSHSCYVTRNRLIRVIFFTQKWGTFSDIKSILFLDYSMTPSKVFVMPSFNYVHMLRKEPVTRTPPPPQCIISLCEPYLSIFRTNPSAGNSHLQQFTSICTICIHCLCYFFVFVPQ